MKPIFTEFLHEAAFAFHNNGGAFDVEHSRRNRYITGMKKKTADDAPRVGGFPLHWNYMLTGKGGNQTREDGYMNIVGVNVGYIYKDDKFQSLTVSFYSKNKRREQLEAIPVEADFPTDEEIQSILIKFWEEVDARYVPAKDQGVDSEVEKYVQALKESKNVIFHGAPGTGKTFLAKMVAADIVSNGATTDLTTLSPDLQSHIGFVQFHPSYDYTDFVEGLRPVDGDNGQINIRWQPGVFYKFINAAREQKSNPEATFDASWDRLLELIDSKGFIIVPNALRGEFGVELNITGDGLATRTYQSEYGQGEWLSGKGRFYSHNQMYRVYRGLPGVPAGGHDNYRKAILNYMIDHVGLILYNKLDSASQASYVFIIDEINRGELGKIFGELFFILSIQVTEVKRVQFRHSTPICTLKTHQSFMFRKMSILSGR